MGLGWLMVGITFVICVAVVIYVLFKKNGRKIEIELYEARLKKPVRIATKNKIFGYQRRQNDVEKLFLPKEFAKYPIEGLDPSIFIDTTGGWPIVKLLRVSEGMFYPFVSEFDLDKKKIKSVMEDRDLIPFYADQQERDRQKYDNHKPTFLDKYGSLISVTFIIITGIMAFYFIDKHAGDVTTDAIKSINKNIAAQVESLENRENLLNNVIKVLVNNGEIDARDLANTTAAQPLTNSR